MARTANKDKSSKSSEPEKAANRPWPTSIAWSAVAMAVLLVVAVVLNVLIGRVIHWEVVTGLGVLGFIFLSIGRRYHTI